MVPTSELLAVNPPELVARVIEQAVRDANRSADFMEYVGLLLGKTRPLSLEFWLSLGAGMHLLEWEVDGVDVSGYGLPSAQDAIIQAFQDEANPVRRPDYIPLAIADAVFHVFVTQLAWSGPWFLHASIALDSPDEDELVEAMARHLWGRRKAVRHDHGGGSS